ncbi:MAG: type II toxin-antitoxin system HipA family toxin [Armatimonadota bacterium]
MTSELFVWIWLPGQATPIVCGRLVEQGGRIRFVYGRTYRARKDAIALSPVRMDLDAGPITARREGQIPGALADAAPDAWGRRVIEYRHAAAGLGELDYLSFGRGEGIGALHFQDQPETFVQMQASPATLSELRQAADALENNRPLSPELAAALEHGTSIGGARPKATLRDGRRALIAKFQSSTDRWAIVRSEWACLQLAAQCGIKVPKASVESVDGRDVLIVERFDRAWSSRGETRRHMLSALTLLDLDDTEARLASYPDLAEILRRLAADGAGDAAQLYRRMVFNILVGNTDDHAKNHACFWDGQWLTLSPAYDLVPTLRIGQEANQAMEVGQQGRASSLANALSSAGRFGLTSKAARQIVDELESAVRTKWERTFARCGVQDRDIAQLRGRAVLSPAALRKN